jgi:PAS domain S-box-containing protein
MPKKTSTPDPVEGLRRRAEARLRLQQNGRRTKPPAAETAADTSRALHEMEVHQIELEMQNMELEKARNELEVVLEKYTDLYDFAPVGYFSLDEQGRILEVNLTGAALLRVERSRLTNRPLPDFIAPESRPVLLEFLGRVFSGTGKQVCEAALLREETAVLWASFHGASAMSAGGPRRWCRVAVSDITSIKQAQEVKRQARALATENYALTRQIARRQAVEEALKKSERHQTAMLAESRLMQEQLRSLSRQVLRAQEKERQRISRELHDVIAQTLTGINIRLATLKKEAGFNPRSFEQNIARTQKLVEKSVELVHQFARDLRPAVLDDLGLIPALHSVLKGFTARTGIHSHFTAHAGVERLDSAQRTVFYRVAQEALTNVARHAQASRVDVAIQRLPEGIRMSVKDVGKSFQVERVLKEKGGKSLGVIGMRERLEMVGGCFGVESAPGQGTIVTAQVPHGHAKTNQGKLDPTLPLKATA